jgi:putative lipoic acid-binding regulatory protein
LQQNSNITGKISEILNERVLETVLEAINETKSPKEMRTSSRINRSGTPIGQALKVEKITDDEIEASVRALIKEKPGLRPNAYMGLIMKDSKER